MTTTTQPRYEIYDRQTGHVVGRASTLNGARRSRDRRDMAYGAIRYSVRDTTDGFHHV